MSTNKRTLFYNANILTLDSFLPRAGRMLVEGDRILEIGKKDFKFDTSYGTDRKVDLKEKTVLPGFNDGYLHLAAIGEQLKLLTNSLQKIQQKLKNYS